MAYSIINFETGAHWYDKTGNAKHDADLRIARKEHLYPSVTSIDKAIFKNDFLDRWKMNQLVLAAAENFRQPHESVEDYGNRVYQISQTKARDAALFGKELHAAVEVYPQMPMNQEMMPWFLKFENWWKANDVIPIARESVLLDHDLGVAGTADLIAHHRGLRAIVDFKTQDVKVDDKGNKKPAYYDSWPRQLAFYAVADSKNSQTFPLLPRCISLILDSNPNGELYEKVWEKNEILSAYEDFTIAAYQWFKGGLKRKPYWPAANGPWGLDVGVPQPN